MPSPRTAVFGLGVGIPEKYLSHNPRPRTCGLFDPESPPVSKGLSGLAASGMVPSARPKKRHLQVKEDESHGNEEEGRRGRCCVWAIC